MKSTMTVKMIRILAVIVNLQICLAGSRPVLLERGASDSISCKNAVTFHVGTDPSHNCSWVGLLEKDSRELLCQQDDQQVLKNCPISCGVCCADDPNFRFTTNTGTTEGCAGLQHRRQEAQGDGVHDAPAAASFILLHSLKQYYCEEHVDSKAISYACPLTCDSCHTIIDGSDNSSASASDSDSVSVDEGKVPSARKASWGEGFIASRLSNSTGGSKSEAGTGIDRKLGKSAKSAKNAIFAAPEDDTKAGSSTNVFATGKNGKSNKSNKSGGDKVVTSSNQSLSSGGTKNGKSNKSSKSGGGKVITSGNQSLSSGGTKNGKSNKSSKSGGNASTNSASGPSPSGPTGKQVIKCDDEGNVENDDDYYPSTGKGGKGGKGGGKGDGKGNGKGGKGDGKGGKSSTSSGKGGKGSTSSGKGGKGNTSSGKGGKGNTYSGKGGKGNTYSGKGGKGSKSSGKGDRSSGKGDRSSGKGSNSSGKGSKSGGKRNLKIERMLKGPKSSKKSKGIFNAGEEEIKASGKGNVFTGTGGKSSKSSKSSGSGDRVTGSTKSSGGKNASTKSNKSKGSSGNGNSNGAGNGSGGNPFNPNNTDKCHTAPTTSPTTLLQGLGRTLAPTPGVVPPKDPSAGAAPVFFPTQSPSSLVPPGAPFAFGPTITDTSSPTTSTMSTTVFFDICGGCDLSDAMLSVLEASLLVSSGSSADVEIEIVETGPCIPCGNNSFGNSTTFAVNVIQLTDDGSDPDDILSSYWIAETDIEDALELVGLPNDITDIYIQKQPTASPQQSPAPTDLTRKRMMEDMDQAYQKKPSDETTPSSGLPFTLVKDITNDVPLSVSGAQLYHDRKKMMEAFDRIHQSKSSQEEKETRRKLGAIGINAEDDDTYQQDAGEDIDALQFLAASEDLFHCKCVSCAEDPKCGGLWEGIEVVQAPYKEKVHIVVSHCKSDLDWMEDFTSGFPMESITVVSKCGYPVKGAPDYAKIVIYENVGRCDHAYAYFIAALLDERVAADDVDDSVVFFLKDDISEKNLHQAGHWNDFESMLRVASLENGFACGITLAEADFGASKFYISAYHEWHTLSDFSMEAYGRNIKGYAADIVPFESEFHKLGDWFNSLDGIEPSQDVVQVCYGGVFAASVSNIKRQRQSVWDSLEKNLSRGSNIQEGHYAERSWANLLSTPLQPYQTEALLRYADGVYLNKNSIHGALTKKPTIYVHIGAPETSSEIVADALIMDMIPLETDRYSVAVHGRYQEGNGEFPNIDRLAACFWSDVEKAQIPEALKEATVCPPDLLQEFASFLQRALEERKDVMITNPWLVRDSTADGLSHFLDSAWDVQTVVYYRRFYEWITAIHTAWRKSYTWSPDGIPIVSLRYIDFMREYCKILFYGDDVNPDGYPFRDLSPDLAHKESGFHASSFSRQIPIEELTSLNEYTYFSAKQYHNNPRFSRGIRIVNQHDVRKPASNLYCHVLHDAPTACEAAIRREREEPPATDDNFVHDLMIKNETQALEDIVLTAYHKDILKFEGNPIQFHEQVQVWTVMLEAKMKEKGRTSKHLPLECLYQFEIDRLLEVSLAYEKALLPEFYYSDIGGDGLRRDYSSWKFCSVDVAKVLAQDDWAFLFSSKEDFAIAPLPRAYIHVGLPMTGAASIQRAMIEDRKVLSLDNYHIASQASIPDQNETLLEDNVLTNTGHLPACIWSSKTREQLGVICPDGLLEDFREFAAVASSRQSDLLISNDLFNVPSSQLGVSRLLDNHWEIEIVIYYRRFYEWLFNSYLRWYKNISLEKEKAMNGNIRFVDFARKLCARLFRSGHHSRDSDDFVDTMNVSGYGYQTWQRYKRVPRFDVTVVNFHKASPSETFYCDVLKHATNACSLEKDRASKEVEPAPLLHNLKKIAYEQIAMSALASIHLPQMAGGDTGSIEDWTKRIENRLSARGLTVEDLPHECLTSDEQNLLLDISLAYEKMMLPGAYFDGGEEAARKGFSDMQIDQKFCSINIQKLQSAKWSFLFWTGPDVPL